MRDVWKLLLYKKRHMQKSNDLGRIYYVMGAVVGHAPDGCVCAFAARSLRGLIVLRLSPGRGRRLLDLERPGIKALILSLTSSLPSWAAR